ncbi:MAG: serine/threonine-protein kinase [Coleofasciculaceae cyanobacterium]
MSYCLNPNCPSPEQPTSNELCQTCGTKLLLVRRYRAIKLIGQGGFGRTFLAEDEDQPGKPRCVIKQFYPQGQNNTSKAAQLFHQEAGRLEQLGKHPQIPELLAHFEQDNYQYLVQEFIDGQNLAQELIERGAFSESEIRRLLGNLLPVLQFIHKGQVIHRDLKPENIIHRRSDRKLVLVDFGAAKYATPTVLAKTGTTIGSAGYAAPEQTFGKAMFASDIYSLGVTCLHLLTQLPPFDLYDALESNFAWRHYLNENPVSDSLAEILDKMIQSSVRRRYQSAEQVMQALAREKDRVSETLASANLHLIEQQRQALILAKKQKNTPAKVSLLTTLSGHSDAVHAVAFSPNGKILASGGGDKTVKLWQLRMAWEIRTLGGWFSKHSDAVYAVAFSPDGKILASGSGDNTVKLWNVRTGQEIYTLKGHTNSVNTIAFSRDGKFLASGSSDFTIKLWDVRTGKEIRSLFKHSSLVNAIALSQDGEFLASASVDRTIKLWNTRAWEEPYSLSGHSNSVDSVAFSPDGKFLVSGSSDLTLRLWYVSSGRECNSINKSHLARVKVVAFSPDGELIASGSVDKTIKLWNAYNLSQKCILKRHTDAVNTLAFNQDGTLLASGSRDMTIKIWRIER